MLEKKFSGANSLRNSVFIKVKQISFTSEIFSTNAYYKGKMNVVTFSFYMIIEIVGPEHLIRLVCHRKWVRHFLWLLKVQIRGKRKSPVKSKKISQINFFLFLFLSFFLSFLVSFFLSYYD
jgi:hypothetical protein